MIKIPKKLKILGYDFEIILKDLLRDSASNKNGSAFLEEQKIWIDNNQNEEQQKSTFLHEIIEVINMANDLKFTHQQICVLETSLYQILKDNFLQ